MEVSMLDLALDHLSEQKRNAEANRLKRKTESHLQKFPDQFKHDPVLYQKAKQLSQNSLEFFRQQEEHGYYYLLAQYKDFPSSRQITTTGSAASALCVLLPNGVTQAGCLALASGATGFMDSMTENAKAGGLDDTTKPTLLFLTEQYGNYQNDHSMQSLVELLTVDFAGDEDFLSPKNSQLANQFLQKLSAEDRKNLRDALLKYQPLDQNEMAQQGAAITFNQILVQVAKDSGVEPEVILKALAGIDDNFKGLVDYFKQTMTSIQEMQNDSKKQQDFINATLADMYIELFLIDDFLQKEAQERKKREIDQNTAFRIQNAWKGLQQTSNFLNEIAKYTGDKTFQKVTASIDAFMKYGEGIVKTLGLEKQASETLLQWEKWIGMAAGIATIGMAVITIAEIFFSFSKGKQQANFENLVLENLQKISRQIENLQDVVNAQFARMNDILEQMHREIVQGFKEILHQLQIMHIYMADRFDKIEAQLTAISQKLDVSIDAFWLRPLVRTLRALELEGLRDTEFGKLTRANFQHYSNELMLWIRGETTDSLSTGKFLMTSSALKQNPDLLKEILSQKDLQSVLGFLQDLCEYRYQIKITQAKTLYNPSIWYKAAAAYLQITLTIPKQKKKLIASEDLLTTMTPKKCN
jgi:hypothetical protein